MRDTRFDKCLLHYLRTPDGVRRAYILPFEGNLTDRKHEELGRRLHAKLRHVYPSACEADFISLLRNRALTGVEKNLVIRKDEFGTFTLAGMNWASYGNQPGDFAVLDQMSCAVA